MSGSLRRCGVGAVLLLAAAACSKTAPARELAVSRAPADSYELRLGKGLYQHYCQTCHGEKGAGDGFNAFNLDPRPRDLSDPVSQIKTDAELADAIRRGGTGVGLSALMPPWGHTLSARQIEEVVLYLRTLARATAASRPAAPPPKPAL